MFGQCVDVVDEVRRLRREAGQLDGSTGQLPRLRVKRPSSAPSLQRRPASHGAATWQRAPLPSLMHAACQREPLPALLKKLRAESSVCGSDASTRAPSPETQPWPSTKARRDWNRTDSGSPDALNVGDPLCKEGLNLHSLGSSPHSFSQASPSSGWIRASATGGAAFCGRGSPGLVSRLYGQEAHSRPNQSHQQSWVGGVSQSTAMGDQRRSRCVKASVQRRSTSSGICSRPPSRAKQTQRGRCPNRAILPKQECPSAEDIRRERMWSATVLQSMDAKRKASRQKRSDQLKLALEPSPMASPIARLKAWRNVSQGELPSSIKDLAKRAFESYDADEDGRLNPEEFAALLRDVGFDLDSAAAQEAVELVAGPGEQSIGFESFSRLLAHDVKKNFGYTKEEIFSLRELFYRYDMNDSGRLEVLEYSSLLEDLGFVPHTKEASQKLGDIIASCRDDGQLGPLNFDEFIRLVTVLGCEEPNLPKSTGACSLLITDVLSES